MTLTISELDIMDDFFAGDTKLVEFELVDEDGDGYDITDATIYLTFKSSIEKSAYVIEKTQTSFTSPTGGTATITLTPADTKQNPATYAYDALLVESSGVVTTIANGSVKIKRRIRETI